MKFRRWAGVTAGVAAVTLILTACGPAEPDSSANMLESLREGGVIRVANTQVNPPFSFVDENSKVVGYDVDVAEELASRLGIDKVEYLPGTFQTFIPGLEADKWDAVVAGLTITDERKQQVDFTCSYLVNEVSAFSAPGTIDPAEFKSEKDLSGKKVAVTSGGVQEQKISEIDGVEVMTFDNATLALRDVATGRSDMYVGAKFTGAYLADKNDLDVQPIDVELGGLLPTEVTGIAFPKGETEMVDATNTAIGEMIEDGTLTQISKKWFSGLDVVSTLPSEGCR